MGDGKAGMSFGEGWATVWLLDVRKKFDSSMRRAVFSRSQQIRILLEPLNTYFLLAPASVFEFSDGPQDNYCYDIVNYGIPSTIAVKTLRYSSHIPECRRIYHTINTDVSKYPNDCSKIIVIKYFYLFISMITLSLFFITFVKMIKFRKLD